ncbi:MAG: hypothetical protein ACTHK1_09120 [Actinomycetales bacterium]
MSDGELLDDGPAPGRARRVALGAGAAVVAGLLAWHQLSTTPEAKPPRPQATTSSPTPSPAGATGTTAAPFGPTPGQPDVSSLPTDLPQLAAPPLVAERVNVRADGMVMTDSWLVIADRGARSVSHRGRLLVVALPTGDTQEVGLVTLRDGGGDVCPRLLLNRWLTWTEVADQPLDSALSPEAQVAWRLHVRDLRTGDERVLDHGTRTATAEEVCVHDLSGTAVWQRPDGSWRRWQPWSARGPEAVPDNGLSGVQEGTSDGVLYVRDHDEIESDLVWSAGSGSTLVPVATVPHLTDVALAGQHLVWSSGVAGDPSVAGSVRACVLPGCSSEVRLSDESAWRVAAGRDFAAWSSGADGSTLTVRRWDGRFLDLPPDFLDGPRTFAMSDTRLAVLVRAEAGPLLRVYDLARAA